MPGTATFETIVLGAASVPGWLIPPTVANAVVALPNAFNIPPAIQIFITKNAVQLMYGVIIFNITNY